MRRVWVWLLALLAIVGTGGVVLWRPTGGSAADAGYRLASVDRGPIAATVRATGTLNPVSTVLVGSQLSGQVVEILAEYNTPVSKGQVVARIYSEQIKARRDAALADLAQARADRDTKSAQIAKARAAIRKSEALARDFAAQRDRAQAQRAEAQRDFERQSELTARGAGTRTALEQARTQLEIQTAQLASAEAQIASNRAEAAALEADLALAEAGLRSAEALILQREAKLKEIEIDLARTEIRSPVDGVVVKREIELGQTVAASLAAPTLFTIAEDLRQIDIHANIDEADVGGVRADQKATFTVSAYPNRTFEGVVRMVRLGAQTVQNVVTYTAIIGVDNPDHALLPGMTANLQIVTDEREDALRVPNAALRFRPAAPVASARPNAGQNPSRGPRGRGARPPVEEGTESRVYRLGPGGEPQAVPVRLGVTDGTSTEVLRGDLKEGSAVIVGAARNETDSATPPAGPRARPPRLF